MSGILSDNIGRSSGLVKAAATAAGGWAFVEAVVASGDTSIVLGEGNLNADYDYAVRVRVGKMSADTGGQLSVLQFGTSTGPTYQTSGYVSNGFSVFTTYKTSVNNPATNGIPLLQMNSIGGATDEEWSCFIEILNPAASILHHVTSRGVGHIENPGDNAQSWVFGHRTTREVITGLKCITSSNNYATGTFQLYKRKIT